MVTDTNAAITLVMNADRHVTAVFKCGSGADMMPLMMLGALGALFLLSRRPFRSAGPRNARTEIRRPPARAAEHDAPPHPTKSTRPLNRPPRFP